MADFPKRSLFRPLRVSFRRYWRVLALFVATCGLIVGCGNPSANSPTPAESSSPAAAGQDFTIGMVLVGPKNDAGWNQAHYEGIEETIKQFPGAKLEYVDKVNPADRPNVTGAQVADDLIAKGAKLVIFNSDDFKDDALEAAKKHTDIPIIHASGDYSWKEGQNFQDQANLSNIMGKMQYGEMIGGCAAALSSETGKIGFLGALINDETRRYASAAYLGAKHCWENYRQKPVDDLQFKVTWIGFWFNIPGKTLDPTKVADDYYNGGYDVVMSGIDTPEAAVQAKKAAAAGKAAKYVHIDFKGGCDLAPDSCLGVRYYNWNVPYTSVLKDLLDGKQLEPFTWLGPDWKDINSTETSMIGFLPGKALGENQKYIDEFVKGLGDGSINPYQGPLNYQDGSVFLKDGETATDQQVWYMPQLLEGMEGPST
ncbi:BMP family ABC transporter substrate-binding protein [Leptolyngbya sp. PL-A3]|nr:BMP family ABC transporter substrate-binding protein [Leptolyngbya sp. FACHB-8]MBD1911734.1 BMP family ABC transporter substrate-binding protein [Leptolyngbya sp. FACHB-8]MBD2157333.1 BMP family ABC transporter substrate-binding protein [Leptolyngbya sp. FACHB-16]